MDIGKIIGTVVATRKNPSLKGTRLLVVQPLDSDGESVGGPIIATDTRSEAGCGDIIYMVAGGDAIGVLPGRQMPIDVAIVGIVDSISHSRERRTDSEG